MMTDSDFGQRLAALEQSFDGRIPRHRLPPKDHAGSRLSAHRLTRRIAERRRALGREGAAGDPVLARLCTHLRQTVLAERRLYS